MFIISFEIIIVLLFVLSLCADSIMRKITLGMAQHWAEVEVCVCLLFFIILLFEVLPMIKKYSKALISWFAFWNVLRSLIAAKYVLFLLNDLTNYSTLGLGEKVLAMLGIQVMILPLYMYVVFEYLIDKMDGITYKSVFLGGILSSVGMILGILFVLM